MRDTGFTLVETLVAMALLAGGIAAVSGLLGLAMMNNLVAEDGTYTAILAGQKMEQLRSLAFRFDPLGVPVEDRTSDTATSESSGGTGLTASPSDTLSVTTAGYVDYLDVNGGSLGGGAMPPGAAYIRRWRIEPLPADPDNTLVLQVSVTRRRDRGGADRGEGVTGAAARAPSEARFVTLRTRKAE